MQMTGRLFSTAITAAALLLVTAPFASPEQEGRRGADDARGTRKVVAGERYRRGGLYRFLFGADYRDLWTTPVVLEVVDLASFAGGLKPTRTVGHGQTQALALSGANGKSYTFRPILKDPSGLLPWELRESPARGFLTDQMASGHPAGHVIAPGLLRPAGVMNSEPRLVVLPDNPALGEFRAQFGNQIGDLEEWAGSPGFGGSTETIDGETLWKRLRQSPDVRPDARAYLTARLVDQLMGDWDRHRDQWKWAKLPGKEAWQPIPEDRDQAFVRFEGAVIAAVRPQLPLLVKFGHDYSSLRGLTFDGWDVDKRILAGLEKPVWDEVASELRAALTDEVIETAARRMPPEYFEKDGARLISGLKSRRDHIQGQADRFYRYINRTVDVFATDVDELVEARRFENGDLEVTVRRRPSGTAAEAPPYFHRRFERAVTKEVRVYLYGGNDKVQVTGGKHGGVLLRVVAGDGTDALDDAQGGGTRFSGSNAEHRVSPGPGTHWDRRPYQAPPPNKSGDWIPPRDWGRVTGPLFLLGYGPDYGLLVGGAFNSTGYGFRKHPWSDQQSFRLMYATGEKSFRASYSGQFRFENSRLRAGLFGLGSGIEISRFFGFGNDTSFVGNKDSFKIQQDRYQLEPALIWSMAPSTELSLGLLVTHFRTDTRENPLLGGDFYGHDDFTQFGIAGRLRVNGMGGKALPRSGGFASAGGVFHPAMADVSDAFGEIHAQGRLYLGTPGDRGLTLALKGGGQKVFGTFPFFESAFIGGKTAMNEMEPGGGGAVRGLPGQRYAGEASLWGGSELYLTLTPAHLLVPVNLGLLGFVDVGRVFLEGEDSKRWHHGVGGGIFFTSPGRRNLVSLAVARSERNTAFYLTAGFAF
jgi:hypothetical protein